MTSQTRIPIPIVRESDAYIRDMNRAIKDSNADVVRMNLDDAELSQLKDKLSELIKDEKIKSLTIVLPKNTYMVSPEQKAKRREYSKKYYESHKNTEKYKQKTRERYLKNKAKKIAGIVTIKLA